MPANGWLNMLHGALPSSTPAWTPKPTILGVYRCLEQALIITELWLAGDSVRARRRSDRKGRLCIDQNIPERRIRGLVHEHQNPAGGIQWNEAVVIREAAKSPNFWDEATTRHNNLRKY